ncbi:SDR family oxidoreductase [Actinokineospora terrae]|uniref:Uncharacterized oxidoreductase n=1 Tax=Actinokineospora terrae TaxID=155974 RepID=A0A1H9LFI3_9PSEU|nr:SDR family NAD(P)-dependent oxidoreductase [Actinokineospora terrae]SER09693.1 uncharacterized oxidoreductase [Actinokineospora terrae]
MELTGRTVLVTGGARGVGRELTRQLVELGATVVAVGRDRARLEALAAEHGSRVHPHVVDLADPAATAAFADRLVALHPELSVLINNAGVQAHSDFLADDPAATRAAARTEIAVNLDAVVTLCAALLPHLRAQDSAAVVNVTTGLALAPKASAPVYCATKAGVRTFTRALDYQCRRGAPHVRVLDAVFPLVDTDMTRGRGRFRKISAAQAATAVLDGVRRDRARVHVGVTALLAVIMRVAPSIGYRMMRES